jgi:hypothetical protein
VSIFRFYSNVSVEDTLAVPGGGNLSNVATSLYAGSGAPSGYPTSFPWMLELEPGTGTFELVQVNSGAGTSASPWVVTRGQDGTSARAHNAGTNIAHAFSAGDFTQFATHMNQGSSSPPHGLPASAWAAASLAVLDDTTLANSTTASFVWSSIPNTYKHLMIVAHGRLTETSVPSDDIQLQFNGDSSAKYSYMTNFAYNPGGTLTGPSAGTGFGQASMPLFRFTANSAGSAVDPGGGFAFIPNYLSTAFGKVVYSMSGGGNGTSSFMDLRTRVGAYVPASQAAVTSISILAPGASNFFVIGTRFTLYGIG